MRASPLLLILAACGSPSPAGSYLVYVRNSQGSVVAAVDDRGAKVWETHDDSYGLRLASSGAAVPREFLDQPLDEETGFYQFQYRTYDPATAQWLQPDPKLQNDPGACAAQPQLCDPYAYAGDRPEEWSDPDGRWVQIVTIGNHTYLCATIGIFGKSAAQAGALLAKGIEEFNAVPGNRKILAHIVVYAREADVPKSFSKIDADFSRTDRPSSTTLSHSRIDLGSDVETILTSWGPRLAARLLLHEVNHLAGATDRYAENIDAAGNRSTTPWSGYELDVMGSLVGFRLGLDDQAEQQQAQAQGSLNQGLETPIPPEWGFHSNPALAAPLP